MRRALPSAALLLPLLLSCSDEVPVTEIVVAIDSDIPELNRVEVKVDFFSDEREAVAVLPDVPSWPQTLGIVHEGGELGPIDIVATGFVGDAEVAVRRLASVSFVRRQTRVLRMNLTQNCVNVYETCVEGSTCADGRCTSAAVSEAQLERWSGPPSRNIVSGPAGPAPGNGTPSQPPPTPPPSGTAGSGAPPATQDAGAPMSMPPDEPLPMDAGTPVEPPPIDAGPDLSRCANPLEIIGAPECHVASVSCTGAGPFLECDLLCDDGWGDCDGDQMTGCETELLSNPEHCGECGRVCPAGAPLADGCICDNGEPVLQCMGAFFFPLFADCDGDLLNGCEVSLDSNEHCGACGNQCESCQMFRCAD